MTSWISELLIRIIIVWRSAVSSHLRHARPNVPHRFGRCDNTLIHRQFKRDDHLANNVQEFRYDPLIVGRRIE